MAIYRLTPARRIALKKAQIASARKRKRVANGTNTTISRKNGTTYKTTYTKRIIGGHSVETKAYKHGEFKGVATGVHTRKKAVIDDLYVAKDHRGKGISKELVARQVAHAKKRKRPLHITKHRTDGGQKFVERNNNQLKNVTVAPRKKANSAAMTSSMDFWIGATAGSHTAAYKKTRAKSAANARKAKAKKKKR